MPSFSKEQVLAVQCAGNTTDNMFVTGAGGTGKSRVLQLTKQLLNPGVVVVAVTALAAMQVDGFTIDSVFRNKGLQHSAPFDTLIIEEISMVSKDLFDYMDKCLRNKFNSTHPMGGIRVIAFGDFYQLPPLSKQNGKLVVMQYAYESSVWDQLQFKVIKLKTPMRCVDNILSSIRIGDENDEVKRKLLELTIPMSDAELLDTHVHLFFSKNDANAYNTRRLNKLHTTSVTFKATVNHVYRHDFSNIPYQLTLKVGARVMCIKNDTYNDKIVANGECGTVTNIIPGTSVTVTMDNKSVVTFVHKTWYVYISDTKIFAVKQIPLILAWGITINKAQGLTLDKVVAHLTNNMYPGQAYVAVSRVRSLDNLRITNYHPNKNTIQTNTASSSYA